jgi:hypothetical protein
MRQSIFRFAAIAPLAALLAALPAGCGSSDVLAVPNLNNPDVARAYGSPAGVEAVINGTFKQFWNVTNNCTTGSAAGSDCVNTQGHLMALEAYSELNNFGMGLRASIPRSAVGNDRGNGQAAANNLTFGGLSRVTRTSANAIIALNALIKASPAGSALPTKAQDARALSFAYFTLGISLGHLAMVHDSAALVTPAVPSDEVPGLSSYTEIAKAALLMLDTAIVIASSPNATNGTNGFPLPNTWINSLALTQDQFIRTVKSFRAKIRAAVPRSAAERAAVDWTAVIADANGGYTTDWVVTMSSSLGWSSGYDAIQMFQESAWGLLSAMVYGMADTSGAYANFIASSMSARDGSFLIRTPDQRFPQGATRAAQNADTPLPLPAARYIQNRLPGNDVPMAGWGFSQYDHRRWYGIRSNSNNGPYTAITKVELDMLAAEGYIRAGNFAAASALIDASRAKSGLPSIGTITSATQQIAGGNACVPKVPQAPGFNTVGCGTILEAMKWEKRMETAFACVQLCWFTDSRGWGDLPENTALFWAVPYQEMDARLQPFYSTGGGLAGSSAPKGTYGF